jgi:hypothetical protein
LIIWIGLILLFLVLAVASIFGLVRRRTWRWPIFFATVLLYGVLLVWTAHVRRVLFSESLWSAAREGDMEEARKLLSWGADPNCALEFGTPLEEAKKSGNKEMVKLLEKAK